MTQQSLSNSQEASSSASSSGNSASTSATDVYPLPFSFGQKEIVQNSDERRLVTDFIDNNVVAPLAPGANICITDSSDVLVGNPTYFNSDVTIYQYINGNRLPELQNGGVPGQDEVQCNKNDIKHNTQNTKQNILKKWRYLIIPFLLLLVIFTILLSLYIFKDTIFHRPPSFPPLDPHTNRSIQGHPLYSKLNWGALPTRETPPPLPLPSPLVIISHSATPGCNNFKDCATQTQRIQYDFQNDGHVDIGYNFVIGGDGGIYEGRGWELQNSLRVKSISISFIGDFNKEELGMSAQNAAKALLEEGMKIKMLAEDYKLIGENQTSPLRYYSPGWNAVKVIRNWEHFFPGTML